MTSERTRIRMIEQLRRNGIRDERVLMAMSRAPRHLFMDEALSHKAYEDTALPIKYGQTISQPWVVARMTEMVIADGVPDKVLELGTGSGYQAAVLAHLVTEVFSVERIAQLSRLARRRFVKLGYRNIRCKTGDGFAGWPNEAPFDLILGTAAPSSPPLALLQQVRIGGRMILPVGDESQQLLEIIRLQDGHEIRTHDPVVFVPMLKGTER